jgi:hypothetical protein
VTIEDGHGEDRLRSMIRSCAWLMRILTAVRWAMLPDGWVGAGAIRDLVWDQLYGSGFNPGDVHDVDVAFFDPDDLSRAGDEQATGRLHDVLSEVPWQARNQAAVHAWYASRFGGDPVRPLLTIADGTSKRCATGFTARSARRRTRR